MRTELEVTIRFIMEPGKAVDDREVATMEACLALVQQIRQNGGAQVAGDVGKLKALRRAMAAGRHVAAELPATVTLTEAGKIVGGRYAEHECPRCHRTLKGTQALATHLRVCDIGQPTPVEGIELCAFGCGREIRASPAARRLHARFCTQKGDDS